MSHDKQAEGGASSIMHAPANACVGAHLLGLPLPHSVLTTAHSLAHRLAELAAMILSVSCYPTYLTVLTCQVKDYGYVPAALPDSNCFGGASPSASASFVAASPASSSTEPLPALFGTRINELSRSIFPAPAPSSSTDMFATAPPQSTSSSSQVSIFSR